jgi:hypothetical protein
VGLIFLDHFDSQLLGNFAIGEALGKKPVDHSLWMGDQGISKDLIFPCSQTNVPLGHSFAHISVLSQFVLTG